MTLKEKIQLRILVTPSGCWEWQGAKNSKGYGQVWCGVQGKSLYCHRIMSNAGVADLVMHSCDNPICCNPEHLSLGSPKENSEDMVSKGRSHRGYKLCDETVMIIQKSEESGKHLASLYNVSQQTISDIRNGRTYGRLRG